MVFKAVASLAGILQYHDKTIIDSRVFRLHYRWTSTLIFLACILLTCAEIIGKPITCMGTKGYKAAEDYVVNYCHISATFTLDVVGIQESIKGNIDGLGTFNKHLHEEIYHAYYLWVPFVLFGMGCMFYLPHIIWKSKEGKIVERLLQGLDHNSILDRSSEKVENIVRYMEASKGINGHYFYFYMGTEVLNLVNVVTQMFLLDKFIGGQFWTYGIKSLTNLLGDENQRQDPMIRTFPRITKCTFSFIGKGGGINEHDYMCLLPQNILNEKVFLIIWIWFIFLTTITASYVVMRLVLFLSPILNARFAGDRSMENGRNGNYEDGRIGNCEEQMELQNYDTISDSSSFISRTLPLGDYCLLELLQNNLDYATYQSICHGLHGHYSVFPELALTQISA